MTEFKIPKKLIEVALPLDKINEAAGREKSIRHGHPSTLHLWWARRPLAAARAVIFAQMVNDPGYERHLGRGVNKKEAEKERKRLFALMEKLVQWENTNNEEVLSEARAEIMRSWQETCRLNKDNPRATELFNPDSLPAFHDPFAGGGTLPLEAQRLGLESYASDLNPVAVLINKAMIEILPKFTCRPPINPEARENKRLFAHEWCGAQGLAEDVRHYGKWVRNEAEKRIGHFYPKLTVTESIAEERPDLRPYVGQALTVIAWIWARTVKSPNPAFSKVDVPLTSTFLLSTKAGKEVHVEPVVHDGGYRFVVRTGKPKDPDAAENGTKLSRGANFYCVMSGSPISQDYIRAEFKAKRAGMRLMGMVAEGKRARVYLSPTPEMEDIARQAVPEWRPDAEMNQDSKDLLSGRGYGFRYWHELFTPRQLLALTTLADLVQEARERALQDALAAGLSDEPVGLESGAKGARAYADAVATYLSFALSKSVDGSSTICRWMVQRDSLFSTFGRQALPMTWDFAEINLLADCTRSYSESIAWTTESIEGVSLRSEAVEGTAIQMDAMCQSISGSKVISSDPPYYNNIAYADLSDFFYIWLRRCLKPVFPALFSTIAVPKEEELVATPYRHGGTKQAEVFFLEGMTRAMQRLAEQSHPAFPVSLYYAFKQSETGTEGTASTGWETFLEAVIKAGFSISGTWPMRTERAIRSISMGTNALASSVVLVCQKRPITAETIARKDFIRELRAVLPEALEEMTLGSKDTAPIAPVDLAQAAIGPGMAVYSKYAAILDGSGEPLSVRTALSLINKEIDAYFNQGEGEMDADTRFCLDWFAQYGWKTGDFGTADTLARAKGTSVEGVRSSGVAEAIGGKVRLFRPADYPADWDPTDDERLPLWEGLHQLIRVFQSGGEREAAKLLRLLGTRQDALRQLAYRLYTECERKGWAEDARSYNDLVVAWEHIERALENLREESPIGQMALF